MPRACLGKTRGLVEARGGVEAPGLWVEGASVPTGCSLELGRGGALERTSLNSIQRQHTDRRLPLASRSSAPNQYSCCPQAPLHTGGHRGQAPLLHPPPPS